MKKCWDEVWGDQCQKLLECASSLKCPIPNEKSVKWGKTVKKKPYIRRKPIGARHESAPVISTLELESGASKVQGHRQLTRKSVASLRCRRPNLNEQRNKHTRKQNPQTYKHNLTPTQIPMAFFGINGRTNFKITWISKTAFGTSRES